MAEFGLTDQHGRSFHIRAQRGRVIVLAFGYTSCADLCPLTLSTMKRVHRDLGTDARRARFVLVTVDPRRDTPARLKTYLAAFHSDFLGLTGPAAARERVYQFFGVVPQRYAGTTQRYLVNHPTAIYLIDPAGYLRLSYNWGGPAQDMVHDVRLLLSGATASARW